MSSAGSSIGVGRSPSIMARALPSPISGSWPSPTGFDTEDEDMLSQYVANLGTGVGTNVTPPIQNTPPVGTGTPSPPRSSGPQSPLWCRWSGSRIGSIGRVEYTKSTWTRLFVSSSLRKTRTQSTDVRWKTTLTWLKRKTESRWNTTPTRIGARWRRRRWGFHNPFHGRRRRERRVDPSSTKTSTHGSTRVTTTIGNLIERSTSDGQRSSYCRDHHHQHHHHHVQRRWLTSRHPQFHQCSKLKGLR